MTFRLTDLLEGAEVRSAIPALEVAGISADSRAIAAGEAFFALPGTQVHGDAFFGQARQHGAAVMVSDRLPEADPGLPVVIAADVRRAYALAAARVAGAQPDICVGVTGTNGKTSVASFLRQIWTAHGLKAASIGTLGVDTGDRLITGELTTPDTLSLMQSLAALKTEGVSHVALEASSHGIDQRRLDGIRFAAAGFTNLSRDHLDYHDTLEAYLAAKVRLVSALLPADGVAVVNADDPAHEAFVAAAQARGIRALTVGVAGTHFTIETVEREGLGQRVRGRLAGAPVSFFLPLTGRFQVDNAVLALVLALETGAELDSSLKALGELKGAKGRMELVASHNNAAIFVDYAHTPAALETALKTLRPYVRHRLIVVFGAGGDRDPGKRGEMGAVAVRLADRVIVTDDNPRTEDRQAIRAAILAGAAGAVEIGDRAQAIAAAVADVREGDVLLVAGKGHEDYQIIGARKQPFSDHEAILQAIDAIR